MLKENRVAFKEWASIVDVLGRGEQILILRKGGIHEKGKKFDVAHEEFFLFPTFEHQNPKDLKPSGQDLLKKVLANQPEPSVLPIQYYCVVGESFWVNDGFRLRSLDPFHVWSEECIQARFDWGEEKGLFGILVRTYAFPEKLILENLKRYGGCRSWVELEKSVETASLKPVLSEAAFQEKKRAIEQILRSYTAKISASSAH